jgi:hypothetical protein
LHQHARWRARIGLLACSIAVDDVTRTRILALIRHLRTRVQAGLPIAAPELAERFRLDAFLVERLIEGELGLSRPAPADAPASQAQTREMPPPAGSSLE